MLSLPLLHTYTNTSAWWHWHLHPEVHLFCIVLEVAYLYAVTQLPGMVPDVGRVKRSQVILYSLGVFSIWLAAASPLHDVSESFLLSAHMLEHAIYTLISAPLLLAGIPSWLWQIPLRWRGVLPVARVIVHPLSALFIVNMALVILHLPWFMDFALYHHPWHFFFHVILVVTAMIMWWPVLSTVPELPRASYPAQMAYLFVQSLIPTVVASFITFSDSTVYPFYATVPRLWGLSPLADQQLGGGIMKTLGALIIWWFIGLAFFRWYRATQAEEKGLRLSDVHRELAEMGLGSPAAPREQK